MKQSIEYIPLLALLMLSPAFTACSDDNPETASYGEPVVKSESVDFTAEEASANTAINGFNIRMYNKGPRNVSPFCTDLSLAIAASSFDADYAHGVALGIGLSDISDFCNVENKLIRYFSSDACGGQNVNLSVWYNNKYSVTPQYTELLNKTFFADVFGVEMNKKRTLDDINSWCDDTTGGTIPELLKTVEGDDLMFVLCSLDFHDTWRQPFDPSLTTEEMFNKSHPTRCRMLHSSSPREYVVTDNYQAVLLDLNHDFRLVLVKSLKDKHISGTDFYESDWNYIHNHLKYGPVDLSVPEYEITEANNFGWTLKSMHFPEAGMAELMGLNVRGTSTFIQKFSVRFDAAGLNATAIGTIWDKKKVAEKLAAESDVTITFDNPFLYFLENATTGTVLFEGRVWDPK